MKCKQFQGSDLRKKKLGTHETDKWFSQIIKCQQTNETALADEQSLSSGSYVMLNIQWINMEFCLFTLDVRVGVYVKTWCVRLTQTYDLFSIPRWVVGSPNQCISITRTWERSSSQNSRMLWKLPGSYSIVSILLYAPNASTLALDIDTCFNFARSNMMIDYSIVRV